MGLGFNHNACVSVKLLITTAFILLASAPALAQGMADHAGHDMAAGAAEAAEAAEGSGVIRKLDAKSGAVTLQHGPIKALGWPAMTMPFQVSPALLTGLKVGQSVSFTVQPGEPPVITAIKAN